MIIINNSTGWCNNKGKGNLPTDKRLDAYKINVE